MNKTWLVNTLFHMLNGYEKPELEDLYESLTSAQVTLLTDVMNAYYKAGYSACQEDYM